MPEIKNNFVQGKMNKDLDERLIPKGEYREAQNVIIGESEDSDIGAIEVILGNIKKATGLSSNLAGTPEVIGYCRDVKNKKIYYFTTNFAGNETDNIRDITRAKGAGTSSYNSSSTDNCRIIEYDVETEQNTVLVEGAFLNFSKNHLITGTQVIDDLLFFTDNYNQPRKINVARAKSNPSYYTNEDQISVAKYAPYKAIRLVNKNGKWAESNTATSDVVADKTDNSIKSDYMLENFLRFSYRYKYDDGEYSVFAPFTQVVFEPLNDAVLLRGEDQRNSTANQPDVPISEQDVLQRTTLDVMQNAINKVILRVPLPNANERAQTTDNFTTYSNDYKIREIQIVLKESNSRAIKVVKNIKISNNDGSLDSNLTSNLDSYGVKPLSTGSTTYYRQVYKHVYRSEKPFQVLPEDQTTRVFDQTPVQAKALDIVGNRVVFGNFVENYDFPKDESGNKGMNYYIGSAAKGDARFGTTFGQKEYNFTAYKHHNIKQRRTYQVGVVFADKFGRQSPVILSSFKPSSSFQTTDTFTVQPDVVDRFKGAQLASFSFAVPTAAAGANLNVGASNVSGYSVGDYIEVASGATTSNVIIQGTKITAISSPNIQVDQPVAGSGSTTAVKVFKNNEGSWSANQIAHGQAMTMSWNDSNLFSATAKGIYNGVFGADYNPHGWYSYRIVVKQTEQDYYNVYANHPANSWSNTGNTITTTTTNVGSGSFDELTQTITGQQDLGAGGRSWLTLHGDNINKVPRNPSEQDFERDGVMGSEVKLYPKVVAIDGAGPSRMGSAAQEYLDVISIGTAREQGLFNERAVLQAQPSGQAGSSASSNQLIANKFRVYNFVYGKDKNPLVAELPNLNEEPVDVNQIDVSVIANTNRDIDTPFGFPGDPNIGFSTTPQFRSQGLTVFETKPFESLIDIFYESSTGGLVEDLQDQVSGNTVANGPTNIQLSGSPPSFPESTAVGTVVTTVSAQDNSGASNLSYSLANAFSGSTNVSGSFAVNSSTGAVTLQGEFRFKNNSDDNLQLQFYVNDPDVGAQVTSPQLQLNVTNVAPVVPSNSTITLLGTEGAGTTAYTGIVENGSAKENEDHIGLSSSHAMGNTNYNGYFSTSITGNSITIQTTSSWTSTTAQSFFQANSSARTMTITVSEGFASSTFNIQIDEGDAFIQGKLSKAAIEQVGCDVCQAVEGTYYAKRHNAGLGGQPYVDSSSGDLVLFTGNKVFTAQNNASTATAAKYFGDNPNSSNSSNVYKCYDINSSGVVGTVSNTEECDASD